MLTDRQAATMTFTAALIVALGPDLAWFLLR